LAAKVLYTADRANTKDNRITASFFDTFKIPSPFFDFYHLTAIIDLPSELFAEQIYKEIYLDLYNTI
ncbi:MAG: hypothetical protein SPI97_02880, partial [Oscillospiraceae bacterium]|nr:hypothetical protein [Oscillospiraceae bacterium]